MSAKEYGMRTNGKSMRRGIAAVTLAAVVLTSVGCGIIRPVRGRRGEAARSGFLGDYSQLAEKEGYPAQEVYIDPEATWSGYDAFYIESVTLWVKDPDKIKPEDRQMLTDMLYKAVHEKLGEKFTIAERPGPRVIKLRFALTEAKGAIVPLNAITTVVPQLRVVSTLVGLSADTAALVGAASLEGEARDSITDQRLAAVVDARAGTNGLLRAFSKWADVEAACNYWGERARDFFVKQGVQPKKTA